MLNLKLQNLKVKREPSPVCSRQGKVSLHVWTCVLLAAERAERSEASEAADPSVQK
jgi:hypothetical protein